MALPSSGTITMGQLRTEFGDTGTSSLSEFYRGGSLVPSTTTVYEPSATTFESSLTPPEYGWVEDLSSPYDVQIFWNGADSGSLAGTGSSETTWVYNGWTYTKGAFVYDGGTYYVYQIRREQVQSINTGVPTSGTISLSDFYGATA